jgi:hypothetical protein
MVSSGLVSITYSLRLSDLLIQTFKAKVFSASSLIFDSVSEVDSKYSKLVEREYESCTQDLKKWLKKLKVCPRHRLRNS